MDITLHAPIPIMESEHKISFLQHKIQDAIGMDESILAVAIVNSRGSTIASKSKFGAKDVFAVKSGNFQGDLGIWIRAAIEMIRPFDKHFGRFSTLAAFYEDVKVMILPVPQMNIYFVLVCLRSANAELILCKFHEVFSQMGYHTPTSLVFPYSCISDKKHYKI
jgi:hypothetical protein